MRKERGITLIALVITIIVMLILAGVTINLTLGENGIFTTAKIAAKNYTDAQNKEQSELDRFYEELQTVTDLEQIEQYNQQESVNKPKLLTGMTAIKFTDPTDTEEGTVQKTNESDTNWYSYNNKKWANAQTEDGSMWVWIPRYAYKINSDTQTCDIVFLIGTTDKYYDENGEMQTAKRATSAEETVDTTKGYTVHPAFTNETSINYANGGWDKELTGIWVAKFEAGYASGNNTAPVKASSVNYTQTMAYVPAVETGTTGTRTTVRNWLDGEFGETTTAIKYPTFQGITYAMNYISVSDAYDISRALTESGNIYGLSSNTTDSHLMKNSEWGAVAYLSQSKYGLNGTNIYINNVSLDNTTKSVYAVTGMSGKTADASGVSTTIESINNRTVDAYAWTQKEGQKASSTGTIYGVYDMSGGTGEITAGYVANGNGKLKAHGASVAYEGENLKTASTKYTTVYPHDSSNDNTSNTDNINAASEANYEINTKIYGDAIRETSTAGIGSTAWYGDGSAFSAEWAPFFVRSGQMFSRWQAGVMFFYRLEGFGYYHYGFRSVLVAL